MIIIAYLMDHGWEINDNAIDKIQDTLVDFYTKNEFFEI